MSSTSSGPHASGLSPTTTRKTAKMETETIKIEGMHCEGCANRVRTLFEKEPGVREADVSYEASEARVKYNERTVSGARLRELIEQAGYTAGDAA